MSYRLQQFHFELATTLADQLEKQLAHTNAIPEPVVNTFLGVQNALAIGKADPRRTKTQMTVNDASKYCSLRPLGKHTQSLIL